MPFVIKKYVVFFDFDNTITKHDVLDDMLARFSRNNQWLELEEKWKRGKIGSLECLKGQIEGIDITKTALDRYLSKVKIDPYFKRLRKFLNSRNIKTIVLSDNFDYILKNIIKYNGIHNLKTYSNKLKLSGNRLIPFFPFSNKKCGDCAHCKKTTLLTNSTKDDIIVYIGDGLSDVCPAEYADLVFAKGYLLKCMKNRNGSLVPYKTMKDIYDYFAKGMS